MKALILERMYMYIENNEIVHCPVWVAIICRILTICFIKSCIVYAAAASLRNLDPRKE